MRKSTNELENMILENNDLINSIKEDTASAKHLLNQLRTDKNISISKLGNDLGIGSYAYEIFDYNNGKKASRNKIIAILIYLNCEYNLINEILQKLGYSKIYVKVIYDAHLYFCINNNYSIDQTNEYLINNGFEPLL